MAYAHLTNQKLQEVHFNNKLTQPGKLQLSASFSFRVNFFENNTRCIAVIYQSLKQKDSDNLFVSVEYIGNFICEDVVDDDDKKAIHVQCYDQMFPYIQTIIEPLMRASGLTAFQLARTKLDADKVQLGRPPEQSQNDNQQFPIV